VTSSIPAPPVTTVTAYPNGPLIVRGPIDLRDEHGDPIPTTRHTVALCRCGVSAMKPWCDGTHKLSGFVTGGPVKEPDGDTCADEVVEHDDREVPR